MACITMAFELCEEWKAIPANEGLFLFWTSPSRAKADLAAHVYESLGQWEWYAFTPTGHQADKQGKAPTIREAKAAALKALREFASAS